MTDFFNGEKKKKEEEKTSLILADIRILWI